jgi:ketosteroid isomerase-like protein
MPERAPDVEEMLRESLSAMERSDVEAIARRMSRDDSLVSIGSDPGEWTEGHEETMRLWRESMPDAELHIRAGLDEVTAYREGDVAWAAGRGWFEAGGRRVPTRMTAVLRREDGEWRFVQTHASIGVPNDRMFDAAE